MSFIDSEPTPARTRGPCSCPSPLALRLLAAGWLALVAGCGAPPAAPSPASSPGSRAAATPPSSGPTAPSSVRPAPASALLAAPSAPGSLAQLRSQAALRIVAANPGRTYSGKVPDVLLAIPVLEVELNADGSVRRIEVLRPPRQALDTVQLAIDAVKRAGPFGDVSRLPRPWKFTETFLFDDDRKFKPRSLD